MSYNFRHRFYNALYSILTLHLSILSCYNSRSNIPDTPILVFNKFSIKYALTFPIKYDPSPGSPQRLVTGGGDNITIFKRGGHHFCGHQSRNVRHVRHQISAVGVGNLPKSGVVKISGIATDSGDDEFGFEKGRISFQLVVVDKSGARVDLHCKEYKYSTLHIWILR